MSRQFSRRTALKLAAASSATVIGFDPCARSRVTQARAETPSLESLPKLDGLLLQDEAPRQAIAVDRGNIFHRVPAGVLNPGSRQDVVRMVRYANEHGLKIVMKGQGHSRYGQTQAEAGIVINSATLNNVHTLTTDTVDAEPGASWGDVARVTLTRGLSPPVMPDTMTLTVGGTLSAGGLGNTSQHFGAQVDNVTELDVVTGDGRLVTCSTERESELFDTVLSGMGQCGIIVRAKIRLVPARSHVVLHTLTYDDLETYLVDQQRLMVEGRLDHQYGAAIRKDGRWRFNLQVGNFFTPPDEPDLTGLEKGLQSNFQGAPVRLTYWDYLERMVPRNTAGEKSGENRLPTPAIAMWIPASATKEFVSGILALPAELGDLSAFSLGPLNTRRFTRPLFKAPTEELAFGVWLFRSAPLGDQVALSALLESNQSLLARMTAVGGKRYLPYSMIISQSEWAEHFGSDVWQRFTEAKRRFDPNKVLTPGTEMFA